MIRQAKLGSSASRSIETFARVGLIAKGLVYCLVGALAFMAAFEIAGSKENAGNKGVFDLILKQPFGKVLLAIVALGLICFCIWRFIQAIKDSEHKGSDGKGIRKRIAYFLSGLAYTGLAFSAIKYILSGNKTKNDQQQNLASELLSKPFGQWIAGIVGVVIIGIGLFQVYLALSGKYKKHVRRNNLGRKTESIIFRAGLLGYISRGIVWLIIGGLFLKAAVQSDAKQAGDTNHAFQWLEDSPYGSYLLGAVAIGLICYGVFMFVRARYQPVSSS